MAAAASSGSLVGSLEIGSEVKGSVGASSGAGEVSGGTVAGAVLPWVGWGNIGGSPSLVVDSRRSISG